MVLLYIQRPHEYIIECFGEFYDIAKPGIYITIPRVTKVRSKVKVNTSQLLKLYRDESKPILLKDGIKIKPEVTVTINIHDPYAVTYKLSIHDNFVKELQAIGVIYNEDERYFYAIEDIMDSLIRSFLGALDIETVVELEVRKKEKKTEETGFKAKGQIVEEIEHEADEKLKNYGVDVESLLIPQVEILDDEVIKTLRKKFEAKQNEEITKLQEKVEAAQVTVEIQKALQRDKQGGGEGFYYKRQMEELTKQGLTPEQVANFIATQKWATAAEKGAKVKIIATSEAGKVSAPIMIGIGMGVGQDIAEDGSKTPEKEKEEQRESVVPEKPKEPEVKKAKEKRRNNKDKQG